LITISGVVIGLLVVAGANAQDIETVIFFDDFESADPIGTLLPDSPPIGEDWRFYVSNSVDGSISANPASQARNSSALVYHMTRPDPATPGVSPPILIAPISEAHQDLVLGNANASIEFKYYEVGPYGISLIANEAPVGTVPTGISATGLGLNSGLIQYTGYGTSPGTYSSFEWHDVRLDLNFETQQYTVTIDEVVDSTVPFVNGGLDTITNVWIANYFRPADYYFDDIRVTTEGPPPPPSREWDHDGTGNWIEPNHWSPRFVPNASDHVAVFGSKITAPSTVIIDEALTVNGVTFDNANAYALAGTGSITLAGTAPSVTLASGSHQFQVAVNLAGDTSVDATGGSLDFNNQIDLAGNMLSTTGAVNINHSVIDSVGGGSIASSSELGTLGATSIYGDLVSTGSLNVDVNSAGQSDLFNIIGSASLEGMVNVNVLDGFLPTRDITILTATAGISLTGALHLVGPDAGMFHGVRVLGNNLVLTAVPEPSVPSLVLVVSFLTLARPKKQFPRHQRS
jgi:hypothetical protein